MMDYRAPKGFTLIEVLVVIGIIGISAGILGAGLRTSSPALALHSAQQIVTSLLEAARTTAALKHARVTVVVDADPSGDGFLRRIRIASETAPDSGEWLVGETGEILPAGIFVVPGVGLSNGVEFSEAIGAWTDLSRSSLRVAEEEEIMAPPGGDVAEYLVMSAPFEESGAIAGDADLRWVVTPGRRTVTSVTFTNALDVRGVILGAYGVGIPIDDAAAFEF